MPHPSEHHDPGRPLEPGEDSRIAEAMKALSTESRVGILFTLLAGDHTVDELAAAVEMDASAVSQQLRVLRQLHFVVASRDGRRRRYRLHDHHVVDLLTAVRHHHEHATQGWAAGAPARVSAARS